MINYSNKQLGKIIYDLREVFPIAGFVDSDYLALANQVRGCKEKVQRYFRDNGGLDGLPGVDEKAHEPLRLVISHGENETRRILTERGKKSPNTLPGRRQGGSDLGRAVLE